MWRLEVCRNAACLLSKTTPEFQPENQYSWEYSSIWCPHRDYHEAVNLCMVLKLTGYQFLDGKLKSVLGCFPSLLKTWRLTDTPQPLPCKQPNFTASQLNFCRDPKPTTPARDTSFQAEISRIFFD